MVSRLIYICIKLVSFTPLPVSRFLGRILAGVLSFLPLRRTTVSLENIRRSYNGSMGLEGAKKLNRKVLLHFSRMLFEVPHILNINKNNLEKYVTFVHEENLHRALKKGKGAFILTGHFGNWEIISAAISLRFGRLSIVARPFDFKPLDRVMQDLRSRFGGEIIPKQKAMRKILDSIRKKRIVGILLDQNVDWYAGVFVKFLGRWACTNKGLALLALKTGAPVIPAFSVRHKDGRYRIVFEDEVRLIETGDKTKNVEENTALFTRVIEDYVLKYPDQWLWFHQRWKTRPYCPLPASYGNEANKSLGASPQPVESLQVERLECWNNGTLE